MFRHSTLRARKSLYKVGKEMKKPKHLFINDSESLDWKKRDRCKKCGNGRTHSCHLNSSTPLMISWLHEEKKK